MSTLTVRLPDATSERLRAFARERGMSPEQLLAALGTEAIAAWDAQTRFRALAARGDPDAALAVLDRLDAEDQASGGAAPA
jgi:predicted transcriptional regulator